MKYKKMKNKRGSAQYRRHKSSGSGFVMLFAITLSALILAIALGISNIALKQLKFSTSAKDTNEAFFAADVGAECALYHSKGGANFFRTNPASISLTCAEYTPPPILPSPNNYWEFSITGLGNEGKSCANVIVDKINISQTVITSDGYNIADDSSGSCDPEANSVVRQVQYIYSD